MSVTPPQPRGGPRFLQDRNSREYLYYRKKVAEIRREAQRALEAPETGRWVEDLGAPPPPLGAEGVWTLPLESSHLGPRVSLWHDGEHWEREWLWLLCPRRAGSCPAVGVVGAFPSVLRRLLLLWGSEGQAGVRRCCGLWAPPGCGLAG